MNRRDFLRSMGVTAGALVLGGEARAGEAGNAEEAVGILIDTTQCAGCRTCETACAEAHGLPEPEDIDLEALEQPRDTSPDQWTVVNRFETSQGEYFAKKQCMHCLEPACASACLTKAMYKTPEGPVVWRPSKCMGCRFCMVSCPFDVPKFEYDSANPRIQKCRMCWEELEEGQRPACVENCPMEALTFGRRKDLLAEARRRIVENPGDYHDHIYGEHEAGGTSVLYLAAAPAEEMGQRTDLGSVSYPVYTKPFFYAVPLILTLWPAFMLGVHRALSPRQEEPVTEEVLHGSDH